MWTLVLLRSCGRWRGLGIRRDRLSGRFLAGGWFPGWRGGIIYHVPLWSCLGARIHESDAQLSEFGFLGERNSIHAVGNCFPRILQCAQITIQRLKLVFTAEGSRRFYNRANHVIQGVEVAVSLESLGHIFGRSFEFVQNCWQRVLQVALNGFDVTSSLLFCAGIRL